MSTPHHHFTISERESLLLFCQQGCSIRAMARMLGRSPSSVSRELHRNCTITGAYSANAADKAYRERRRARRGPSPHADEKLGRLHGYKTIHKRPKTADKRSQYGLLHST